MSALTNEIDVLRQLDHPYVMTLLDTYEDKRHIHLVSPLYDGGELFDTIIARVRVKRTLSCM